MIDSLPYFIQVSAQKALDHKPSLIDPFLYPFIELTYYHMTLFFIALGLFVYRISSQLEQKLHEGKDFVLFMTASQNQKQCLAHSRCIEVLMNDWMNK